MKADRPSEDSPRTPSNPDGLARLKEAVDQLRTPGSGCPWDLEQTPESLVPYLLEEAHEAAEAIRSGDIDHSRDELGDVLLNVFLQARLAEESGSFTLDDIGMSAADKVVRRHPHVWGDERGADRATIRENWRKIKAQESEAAAAPDGVPRDHGAVRDQSVLRELPATLPALIRAVRSGMDAARIGFDWPDWRGPLAKVEEEIAEVKEAIGDPAKAHHEIGDLLLAITSLARHVDVDPEGALNAALVRFARRFHHVETEASRRQLRDLDSLEALWQDAKRGESGQS